MRAMDGIDWAASAMSAARSRLDIATENRANASSDGFRKMTARGLLTSIGVRIERTPSDGQGALRRTDRPFDLALIGPGAFRVRDAAGRIIQTRQGSFTRGRDGILRDDAQRELLGTHGPLRIPQGARIATDGRVSANGVTTARLELDSRTTVRSGFVETSNVDAIAEMIGVLTAQRSFEAAEKTVAAIDQTRQKSACEVARLK